MRQGLLVLVVVCGYGAFNAAKVSASFVKQPVISSVQTTGQTTTSATVTWVSSVAADSQVEYGTTTGYGSLTALDPTLTKSHTQTLSGLTPNTLYHFAVMSRTSTGTLYSAGDFTFSTAPNVVAGMISALNVSGITATSVTVSWTTSTPTNSVVEFGTTSSYGRSTPLIPEFVTSHTVILSGLVAQTLYHFRVKSADGAGNQGISADSTFTTAAGEPSAVFSGIAASSITSTSAVISWATGYPATSQVDYGTSTAYGSSTVLDPTLAISHSQTLVGLAPNTLYHYRVRATGPGTDTALSADYTFATTSISLFYPELGTAPDTYTGIAISNLDPGSVQLTFAAFGATGSEIQASNLTNPVNQTLGAGAQLAELQYQLFGTGVSSSWPLGWTMLDSSTPHLAGFFLTFDSSLSFMDGAAISTRLFDSFVLPETGSQDYTTLLMANPNPVDASVTIELMKTDGTVRSSVQTAIPAYGTYSADLLAATFAGIAADPSDYVRVSSSQGLLPYEYFGDSSKDFAVLSGQDSTDAGTTLYSPQYALGGPWNTTLSMVNLDAAAGTITAKWIGDDGSQIGATQILPIAAGGKVFVSDPAFFQNSSLAQVTQGYVQITSSGVHLAGSVVFSDAAQGVFRTALPLVSSLQQSVVLSHVASNDTYFTGLSILNPNNTSANVRVDVYTSDGKLDRSTTQIIPAGHRVSRLLTEYFPDLIGQNRTSGYVRVTADAGVACFGVFGTQNLSVLSAIPAQIAQ